MSHMPISAPISAADPSFALPPSSPHFSTLDDMRRDYDRLRQSCEEMAHDIIEASQTVHGYARVNYTNSLTASSALETSAMAALTLEASQRLVDMIARHLSRLSGEIEQHEHIRHNINTIVETAVAMMRPRFDRDGVCVSIMAMGEPLYADVDEGLLYQAISQLLSASLSHPQRGSLLEVLLCDGLAEIKILLIDHGSSPKTPRSTDEAKTHELKADIDLALAEKAIAAHQGTLYIKRAEDGSRVITVQLPKIRPHALFQLGE